MEMKTLSLCFFCLLLSIGALAGDEYQLIDAASGEPLVEVSVVEGMRFQVPDHAKPEQRYTNEEGRVEVSESSYKNGIILESEERVGWVSGMRLSVLREGGVDRLEVAMLPWASISGELRDEQGKPVANVKLELERYSMGIGMNDYAPPATCRPHFLEVTTDENGRFTCERLFPTALESGIDLPYKFKEVFEGATGGNAVVLEAAVLQPGENLEVPLQATPRSSATVKWRFVWPDGSSAAGGKGGKDGNGITFLFTKARSAGKFNMYSRVDNEGRPAVPPKRLPRA